MDILHISHGNVHITGGGLILLAVILIFLLVVVDYEMDRYKEKRD